MCGCEDGEPAEFWREQRVGAARKEHACYECRRAIRAGQSYLRIVAKWDGSIHRMAVCRRCEAFREAWHDVEGCYPLAGGLFEDVVANCFSQMRRATWEERGDEEPFTEPADPECLAFGVRFRTHLGKYGPQLPRRAA